MDFADAYFQKHRISDSLSVPPSKELRCVVVLPSYREEHLFKAVGSLLMAHCSPGEVEIIVVLNSSERDPAEIREQTLQTKDQLLQFLQNTNTSGIPVHVVCYPDMPFREAGVGLARKIGMDIAAARLRSVNRPEGIIGSFDADAWCETNFFRELLSFFDQHPDAPGASVYFEHDLTGEGIRQKITESIIRYELHLRYFVRALRYAGHPHAFQTLGSSFAVRAGTYTAQGGMNKRKAGEDFYFLHKVIPLGNYGEINGTCIHLSPRPSDRVPFGTGAAVRKMLLTGELRWMTYHFDAFRDLSALFGRVPLLYSSSRETTREIYHNLPLPLTEFLTLAEFSEIMDECRTNSATEASFSKRFFRWFNVFRVIKFLNAAHETFYQKKEISEAVPDLMKYDGSHPSGQPLTAGELLFLFRTADRSGYTKVIP